MRTYIHWEAEDFRPVAEESNQMAQALMAQVLTLAISQGTVKAKPRLIPPEVQARLKGIREELGISWTELGLRINFRRKSLIHWAMDEVLVIPSTAARLVELNRALATVQDADPLRLPEWIRGLAQDARQTQLEARGGAPEEEAVQ
jgi:DNA-binding XRE family transcriptional regulator